MAMTWLRTVCLLTCLTPWVVIACGDSGSDTLFTGPGSAGSGGSPGKTGGTGGDTPQAGQTNSGGSTSSGGSSASTGGSSTTASGGSQPSTGGTNTSSGGSSVAGSGGSSTTSGGTSSEGGAATAGAAGNSTTGGANTAGSAGSSSTTDCGALQKAAEEALNRARVCEPKQDDQCEDRVKDLCNCDTPIARNETEATAAYISAKQRFEKAGCSLNCLVCVPASGAFCSPQGGSQARCVRFNND
jgi:hypothetical protein